MMLSRDKLNLTLAFHSASAGLLRALNLLKFVLTLPTSYQTSSLVCRQPGRLSPTFV